MNKKLLSGVLALITAVTSACVFRVPFSAAETAEAVGRSQFAQDSVRGAAILQCFTWSYNEIKNKLPEIAAAGYTAVQTSPVQKPKSYKESYTKMSNEWWKFYQPLTLSLADGGTWLGTKAELKSMCLEAKKYNIKVIADIVANHMANIKDDGGGYENLCADVESDMRNPAYFHPETYEADDDDRYRMTHGHIGMPDLNTKNSHVQKRVLNLLKECADCGVDGFRFDAAKHIELPTDDSATRSDFWPTVINGIKSYKSNIYCYGEILGGAATSLSNYTKYMDVTNDKTANDALEGAKNCDAAKLANSNYEMGVGATHSVLWDESHDTYMGNKTSGISNSVIAKAWAITGARAKSTSMYLARPNSTMGLASSDGGWKSTVVREVNKFKNYFMDKSEYLAYSGNVAYIERGTSGVSIAKLDGGGSVTLNAHNMASGTYKDQVSGNTFTVSGGKIRGTVGSKGVAVVYNAPAVQETTVPATTAPVTTVAATTEAPVQTILVGDANADGIININDATAIQRHISGMESIKNNISAGDCNGDTFITVKDATLIQKYLGRLSDTGMVGQYVSAGPVPTAAPQEYEVYFTNSRGWSGNIYCYYWSDNDAHMLSWPGEKMTYERTNSSNQKIYKLTVPADIDYLMFSSDNEQTVKIPFDGTILKFYAKSSTDSSGKFDYGTW